eukprot:6467704-Lingulodinium_polyedra.AAC.1
MAVQWQFNGRSMLMNCSWIAHEMARNWPGVGQELASLIRLVRFFVWFDRFSLLAVVLDKPACAHSR